MPRFVSLQNTGERFRSLDLDGSVEWLRLQTHAELDTNNNWSVSFWWHGATSGVLLELSPSSGRKSEIYFAVAGSGDVTIRCSDDATPNQTIKEFIYEGAMTSGQWELWVMTWDGTDLKLYRYIETHDLAVLLVPDTKTIDDSGTMGGTDRLINHPHSTFPMTGLIGPLAIWSTDLDLDNVTAIGNPGQSGGPKPFDLNLGTDNGNYTNSASLVHYWRPSTEDLGVTDRIGSVDIVDSTVDSADISTDVPVLQ